MKQSEIESLAFRLLYSHGLYNWGWKFKFHRSKRICGLCNYRRKIISGSKFIMIGSSEHLVRNTLLHEIAHALVGPNNGHNEIWKKKFIEIGGNGNVKGEYNKPTFVAICNECNGNFKCHRRTKKICLKCFPKKIVKLSWERVNYC